MKKVCFVVSHLGSGSASLVAALNEHPSCQFMESNAKYDSVSSVRWLFRVGHKCRDASAVYGDHLLYNTSVTTKEMYGRFPTIFVVGPARHSLNHIIGMGYGERGASSYYRFRLRRICEMAKRSPGSLLLTRDDLAKDSCADTIRKYVGLDGCISHLAPQGQKTERCSEAVVDECQRAYERYYYYLKGLNLRRIDDTRSRD